MAIMNITDMPKRQDAFCVSCKAEVMVLPDLACPRCGDQVAPESLARMPGTTERPTVLLATVPERKPVQPENTRTAESVKPTSTEPTRVTLPSIDDVVRWHADTRRLHESLEATEARLVADLRGVRQMRKLLDHTLGMIQDPGTETTVAEIEAPPPSVAVEPTPAETPRPTGRLALGPAHPAYKGDRKPWSPNYPDGCRDCGATETRHSCFGRCGRCDAKWRAAGKPS